MPGLLIACKQKNHKLKLQLKQEILSKKPDINKKIIQAFFKIDRKKLLPHVTIDELYKNKTHFLINYQVSSQPLVNVVIAEELKIKKGTTILEIGAGSGIQAALFEHLGAKVYTIELSRVLTKQTSKALKELGYKNITIISGDGFLGWPDHKKIFDRIVLTCSYHKIPSQLIPQLKEGGYLLLPLGKRNSNQKLVRYKKINGKMILDKIIMDVAFVPLLKH